MIYAHLQKGDGMSTPRPWLRSQVRWLQKALNADGAGLKADGFFGNATDKALRAFQRAHSLTEDGSAHAETRRILIEVLRGKMGLALQMVSNLMPGFRGDPDFVHLLEGHQGKPYWPGGESGVTLDPGVDLGQLELQRVRGLFGTKLSHPQWLAVEGVLGLRGEAARDALAADLVLQGIRISHKDADEMLIFALRPYWQGISSRFSALTGETVPPVVQTVLLSLAYNRGHGNAGLEPLAEPLAQADWRGLAQRVGAMQQDHQLEGIRTRRRQEAALILDSLEPA